MKPTENVLSLIEIKRRVQEIRDSWGPYERLSRRLAGEARCEALEAQLAVFDRQSPKAA
jgi:hypothetical protein